MTLPHMLNSRLLKMTPQKFCEAIPFHLKINSIISSYHFLLLTFNRLRDCLEHLQIFLCQFQIGTEIFTIRIGNAYLDNTALSKTGLACGCKKLNKLRMACSEFS